MQLRLCFAALATFTFAACSDDTPRTDSGPAPVRDGGVPDSGDAGRSDTGEPDSGADAGQPTACNSPPLVPPASGTCEISAGDDNILIRGNIIVPSGLLENGMVLIDATGMIVCAACDCSQATGFATAKRIDCANGIVSPGLINAHDHITFNEGGPIGHNEIYEHRHDWRTGRNGHMEINTPPGQMAAIRVRWTEIRQLIAGVTSVNGSGSSPGLVRNLDRSPDNGLNQPAVRYETFPLDDTRGITAVGNCMYGMDPDMLTDTNIMAAEAYTPHVSEGIDLAARNEFLCSSGIQMGGADIIAAKTAIVHGVGLKAVDYAALAAESASLIWSARTNIDLYGNTAMVTAAARLGVRIALGTDWTPSGSMNMLREFRCVDQLNRDFFDGFFTDRQLIDMATINAATALWSDDFIGSLRAGLRADIAIFDGTTYRSILEANPDDVVLVFRNGEALYGDASLIMTLDGTGCEPLDVCGRGKQLCIQRDTGTTVAEVQAAISANFYPLFFCTEPENEPSCLPARPGEYSGMSMPDDRDGDGVLDSADLCPRVFDPARPLDQGAQADGDNDMIGDACDPCPLAANTTNCPVPTPDDRDGDMVLNAVDNCPSDPNPLQEDRDNDMIGDVCDACADAPNPGGAPCPATIYQIKQREVQGSVALTNVLVTGVGPTGYFVQTVPGDAEYDPNLRENFSGLFVFTRATGMKPALGDRVDTGGVIGEFSGQIQLTSNMFTVRSSNNMMPAPILVMPAEVATGGARAAQLEAVLIEAQDLIVTNVMPPLGMGDTAPNNEFVVNGSLRVNDYMYLIAPFPVEGEQISYIRGILRTFNLDSKLEPRDAEDVGVSPQLLAIEPAFAYVLANSSTTVHAVVLTRTATSVVTVRVGSNDPRVSVPATVTVPAGARSAPLAIMTLTASTATVTLTAQLGNVTVNAIVRVYDDTEPRTLTGLSLAATSLGPNAMTTGRVSIDLPAPAGGLVVPVSVDPARLGIITMAAAVAARDTTAEFTLMTNTATGTADVVASFGGVTIRAPFTISTSQTRPVSLAGDLLITEVHFNPSGADEKFREWVEVYNTTTDTLTLGGLIVAEPTRMHTVPGLGPSIAPGGYAVLAYDESPAINGGINGAIGYGAADIQLNNSSETLTLRVGGVTIDALAWATGWPATDGNAMCLRAPYPADNSMASSWSASVGTYGSTSDRGHPGVGSSPTNCP